MPDGDPYARIVSVMREETGEGSGAGPVRLRLGNVALGEPLEVIVAGTRQPAGALRLGAGLELEAGDPVLLLTEDDQTFYILMRVVKAL